jgi:hypothetical protein
MHAAAWAAVIVQAAARAVPIAGVAAALGALHSSPLRKMAKPASASAPAAIAAAA